MPSNSPQDPFAVRLRELLRARGLTRAQLAGDLAVSANTVSNWTLGRHRPGAGHMVEIASRLDVTVESLVADGTTTRSVVVREGAEAIVMRLAVIRPERAAAELATVGQDLMDVLREAREYAARWSIAGDDTP